MRNFNFQLFVVECYVMLCHSKCIPITLQVHLSDVEGMGILTRLLWQAANMHLEVTAPAPRTPPRFVVGSEGRAERGETKTSPREVFVSPPSPAPSDPYAWMEMVNGKKVIFAYCNCVCHTDICSVQFT